MRELMREDAKELQETKGLPRGWQRGPWGARMVTDNVRRLSREAEDIFEEVPLDLSESVASAKSAAEKTSNEVWRFFDIAEELVNRQDVRDTLELLPGGKQAV